jgi:hypothetical protein
MNIGWIKLHRRLLNNAIFYKPDYFQVWIYILLKVNHEDNKFIWNNESKLVKKGSGIFSQKEMSSAFKFPISKINRILLYLQNENQISFTGYSKYTEIQVLRWEEYQEAFENGNQKETKKKPKGKQEESNSKPNGNQTETNKNDNNYKNEENVNNEKNISSETSSEVFEKKLCDKEFPKGEPIKVTHMPEEEKKEESSAKEEKADNPPKKPREDLHWKVISAYDQFIKQRTGFPAKIDGTQGQAAKKIITYLINASLTKDEAGCLKVWSYILANWEKLTEYQQNRIKLSEIETDVNKILDQIKNGTPAKQNKRVDTVAPGGNYGKP